jgi:hypothetical protein
MAVPATVAAPVPADDLPDHLTVPAGDLPANAVPASDLPDAAVPTMTVKPERAAAPKELPTLGPLPGKLNLNPDIAPKVPPGAPRPFAPGEWVDNPDGSWSSEITVTVTDPALNGGKPTNVPSLWVVDGKPVRVSEDQAAQFAAQSGLTFPSYKTTEEADAASTKREADWQGLGPRDASKVPPLWEKPQSTADKYAGWDTPGTPTGAAQWDRPTTPANPEWVPFNDPPGSVRGTYLPIYRSPEGQYSPAVPEFIASPIRGMIEGGQEARGVRPPDDPAARGDIGAAAGFGARPAAKLFATPEQRAAENLRMYQATPEGQADALVAKRLNQDVKAGTARIDAPVDHDRPYGPEQTPSVGLPPTAAGNVVSHLDRMRPGGGTVIDVGGSNVESLAGTATRSPGVGGGQMRASLAERDKGAPARTSRAVRQFIAGGPSRVLLTDDLVAQRSIEARPMFREAFRGGSVAPLHEQFRSAWEAAGKRVREAEKEVEVAQSQLTAASSKLPVTRGNVYSESAARTGVREATNKLHDAEEALERAEEDKDWSAQRLAQAQDDIANNTPGAVWSPQIARLLNRPAMRAGLARGREVVGNDAAAAGEPARYWELAEAPDGDVIRVPTTRILHIAKTGLDAIIADHRDPLTGKLDVYGTSVDNIRRSLLAEMDAINPAYKEARAVYAGTSASLDAVQFGDKIVRNGRMHPDDIAKQAARMTDTEMEFARLGVAGGLLEKIHRTGFSGDEARSFIKSEWNKQQIRPFFRSEADFTRFMETYEDEALMKQKTSKLLGGSQTAERQAADASNHTDTAIGIARTARHAAAGDIPGAIVHGVRTYRDARMLGKSEPMTEALSKTLLEKTPIENNGELGFPVPTMRPRPGWRFAIPGVRWGNPAGEPVPTPPGPDEPFNP